ncbi:MAG: ECF transporter S component [Lachnospiraceae bacterium]|nr:hypothetical protein [uncultured Acetatifactor sp.]MCI8287009.1 ECF transporter S component [Lachnospiraceae bacterium]
MAEKKKSNPEENRKRKTLWITHTAVFIALLVVIQIVTAALGNTIITGTLVNAVLIISVMTGGMWSGAAVAAVSPVMAKLLGIGPLWSLIPFIAAGNLVLVIVWHFLGSRKGISLFAARTAAVIAAAIVKFLVLYLGIVKIAVPLLLKLPEPQAKVISGMFSISQLITALLGGIAALPVLVSVKKASLN